MRPEPRSCSKSYPDAGPFQRRPVERGCGGVLAVPRGRGTVRVRVAGWLVQLLGSNGQPLLHVSFTTTGWSCVAGLGRSRGFHLKKNTWCRLLKLSHRTCTRIVGHVSERHVRILSSNY